MHSSYLSPLSHPPQFLAPDLTLTSLQHLLPKKVVVNFLVSRKSFHFITKKNACKISPLQVAVDWTCFGSWSLTQVSQGQCQSYQLKLMELLLMMMQPLKAHKKNNDYLRKQKQNLI